MPLLIVWQERNMQESVADRIAISVEPLCFAFVISADR